MRYKNINIVIKLIFRKFVAFAVIFLFSGLLTFAGEKTGTSSCAFLKISPLPQICGMANTYSALSLGAGSTAYNPAGISSDKKIDMILSYSKWFGGISNNFLSMVYNSSFGSFGFSIFNISTGDLEITTPDNVYGTGENFCASEYAFGLSYSSKISDKLSIGATGKLIKSYLMNETHSGEALAFDIGTQYNIDGSINMGITLKNLGSDIKYMNESNNLPASLSIGISNTTKFNDMHQLLYSGQIIRYSDSDENYCAGIEYNYSGQLFIRAGYKFAFGSENQSNMENFSGGLGFIKNISAVTFKLDYSYTNYKYLSGIHRFSLQVGI